MAMPTTTRCLILAVMVAGLGLGLRMALPVTPVDAPFRAVLKAYAEPASSAAPPSNTDETSPP